MKYVTTNVHFSKVSENLKNVIFPNCCKLLVPNTKKQNEVNGKKLARKHLSTISSNDPWGTIFKNGPSKICERQPLKNLKGYGLRQHIGPFLEYFFSHERTSWSF